jgi:hypothetical protein
VRLDRRITGDHLVLKGVEQLEVLLEDKDVLGTIVPGEGGRDLLLRDLTPAVAMLRQGVGVGPPRDDVAEDAQSGEAGDILITVASWRFIWTRAFCMRWTCVAALCTRVSRWRRYARRVAMAAVGRKLPRSNPTLCNSWSHWQSMTSVLRPGTFFT